MDVVKLFILMKNMFSKLLWKIAQIKLNMKYIFLNTTCVKAMQHTTKATKKLEPHCNLSRRESWHVGPPSMRSTHSPRPVRCCALWPLWGSDARGSTVSETAVWVPAIASCRSALKG